MEEYRLLRDYTDLSAQGPYRHALYVAPVDLYLALARVIKSRYEVDQRGFTAAARAHYGDDFAFFHLEIYIFKDERRFITEIDVFEGYPVLEDRQVDSVGPLFNAGFGVEHIEDPFGRGKRLLVYRVDAAKPVERPYRSE